MKKLLWCILAVLVFAFVSPWVGIVMGVAPLVLYVGGWYVMLRLLGILR